MSELPPERVERIDRAQLERILQRATELQAGEHEIGEGLTQQEVIDLGKDVGIPAVYLRQAMLEQRSRSEVRTPAGVLNQVFGPAEVGAVRVARGEPATVEQALLRWMEKNELLVVLRHQPGRISWERLGGMQAALRRGMATFDSSRARFMLDKVDQVHATVTTLEPGYCHVSLSATLRETRGGYVGGAATLAGVGAVGSAVLFALSALPLVALAPLPVGLGLAWTVSRHFRPVAGRVQLGLERALDHAEGAGERPSHQLPPRGPRLIELLAGEVRRALAAPPGGAREKRRTP